MKTKIGILLIYFLLSACALKREKIDLKEVKQSIITLKDNPKIDTAIFNRYIKELNMKRNQHLLDFSDTLRINLKKGHRIEVRRKVFRRDGAQYVLEEYNFDGELVKETKLLQYYPEIQVEEKIDKYFRSFDRYYLSGRIKSRWVRSNFNFYVGKKYFYDERGNLFDIIDTDEGYLFTYEDALKFYVRKWKRLVDAQYGRPVKIDKGILTDDNNRKFWSLTHKDEKTGLSDIYLLDAKSGEVFRKSRVDRRERL